MEKTTFRINGGKQIYLVVVGVNGFSGANLFLLQFFYGFYGVFEY